MTFLLVPFLTGCTTAAPEPPAEDSEDLQAILEYLLEFDLDEEGWVDPEELEDEAVFPEQEYDE